VTPAAISSPEQLFAEHGKDLYRWARRILNNTADAEDCLQDAFVLIVRFWNQCDKTKAYPWAVSIIRNQAMATLRKEKVRCRSQHCSLEAISHGEQPMVSSHEGAIIAKLALIRATKQLTAAERHALGLWVSGHIHADEVGPCMKSREYRAVHRVRKLCSVC
jgi:RNA polymerase sigma factor (sigma-70 family)